MGISLKHTIWLLALLTVCAANAFAQRRNDAYEEYIKKYRSLAVREMKHHHIPASITLAQGLLESGAGKSALARKSNNHFGIKCGGGWKGPSVKHDDDARGECFRKYKSVKDSYEDHSKFLTSSPRYAKLFKLRQRDYKGWAKGLKKAGYATDPRYADRLIDIIETYGLSRYDRKGALKHADEWAEGHQTFLANGMVYVIAQPGDTFQSLSKELGISAGKLRKWNELPKEYLFEGGEIVYLEEKMRRANEEYVLHVVKEGDSMYSISQKYGVRLDRLYKMNGMNGGSPSIQPGDFIRLR